MSTPDAYTPSLLAAAYRAARAAGDSPRYLASHLRRVPYVPPCPLGWEGDTARGVCDGFDIVVKLEPDDSPDTSHLGTWTSTPGADSVDRKRTGRWERGEYRYWTPPESRSSLLAYYRRTLTRHAADCAARADIRRMYRAAEDFARDGCSYVACVTAHRAGVKLGTAYLGGLDYYTGWRRSDWEAYLTTDLQGTIAEAVSEAENALSSLCGCANGA